MSNSFPQFVKLKLCLICADRNKLTQFSATLFFSGRTGTFQSFAGEIFVRFILAIILSLVKTLAESLALGKCSGSVVDFWISLTKEFLNIFVA